MFVSNIRKLRTAKGWTQKELAQRVGVSQMCISNIETNKKSTTLDTLEKIYKAFDDVCIYDIFYYECNRHDECNKMNKNCLGCKQLINHLK